MLLIFRPCNTVAASKNFKNFTMSSLKFLMTVIIGSTLHTAVAQNKQQKVLENILTDQKKWQQSKMPTTNYYNGNFTYKTPMFPGERLYTGSGISPYQNITVPRKIKNNFLLNIKYPVYYPALKKDSMFSLNKSYLRFK